MNNPTLLPLNPDSFIGRLVAFQAEKTVALVAHVALLAFQHQNRPKVTLKIRHKIDLNY